MITAASAAAQKLGLKVKQMDVVMGILSEREVLIKRCGKCLLWSRSGMRKRQTTAHPSHHTAVLLIAFLRQHGSELLNGHLGFGEGLHHHGKRKPKG